MTTNDPRKHFFIGVSAYMIIMFIGPLVMSEPGTGITNTFLDVVFLTLVFGTFLSLYLLIYPLIMLFVIYTIIRYGGFRFSPILISSTLIFYGLSFQIAPIVTDMFKTDTGIWPAILLSGFSCAAGYAYANYKTLKEEKALPKNVNE